MGRGNCHVRQPLSKYYFAGKNPSDLGCAGQDKAFPQDLSEKPFSFFATCATEEGEGVMSPANAAPVGAARTALEARPTDALSGCAKVPGDKSISHRALLFSALAVGESRVSGLLEGEDVLATAAALRALGVELTRADGGEWHIWGCGLGGLREPDRVLDMGNSGTAARLLMGLLAGHPLHTVMTGDASLCSRPMARVVEPLSRMGASFRGRQGQRLPMSILGRAELLPLHYELPVASAQVKSAILLAGLSAPGETCVIEPQATRDHSENMLRHFGAALSVDRRDDGSRCITLTGQPELRPRTLAVPGDPSSAAFPLVAAAVLPGSELRLEAVGLNPLRTGLITCLEEMGANIEIENRRDLGGESVGDLVVRGGSLQGITVPAERAPSMIDEYPILAVAAACAKGRSHFPGLSELRVKESDRLAAMAQGLAACGLEVEEGRDSLTIDGAGGRPAGGATIASRLDHRIAMSFLVLGLAARLPVAVDDASVIETSFPDFRALMAGLGANFAALA
jgi:3-phosphoshikimate 1-carboxyvinyltransferase